VHVELTRQGVDVADELVGQLMRQLGLLTCQPRPYRPTTTVHADEATIADLVARDFTALRLGTSWLVTLPIFLLARVVVSGHGDRLLF
jgi:putative transposase